MKTLMPWKWGKSPKVSDYFENQLQNFWENPFDFKFPELSLFDKKESFSLDIDENEKEYVVKAELPGMEEKDIDVSWQDGFLTIKGEKKKENTKKEKDKQYSECSYGYFHRTIPFGEGVEWSKATAKYKKGVLTVNLPKNEQAHKKIEVKLA